MLFSYQSLYFFNPTIASMLIASVHRHIVGSTDQLPGLIQSVLKAEQTNKRTKKEEIFQKGTKTEKPRTVLTCSSAR